MLEQTCTTEKIVDSDLWEKAYLSAHALLDEVADEKGAGAMSYAARAMVCAIAVHLVERVGPLEALNAIRWVFWPGVRFIKKVRGQLH